MSPPLNALLEAPPDGPQSVLQTHLKFFDRDEDGIINPLDTYVGFRDIGFGIFFSTLAMFFIHLGFAYATGTSWIPDPWLRIHLCRVHRAIHGSDSRAISREGEFDNTRFERVFEGYGDGNSLSFWEVLDVIHGCMNPFDIFGSVACLFEWGATYLLLWPEDGRMKKEDVLGVIDGSIYPKLAERVRLRNRRATGAQEEERVQEETHDEPTNASKPNGGIPHAYFREEKDEVES